jgi:hypothetical protein
MIAPGTVFMKSLPKCASSSMALAEGNLVLNSVGETSFAKKPPIYLHRLSPHIKLMFNVSAVYFTLFNRNMCIIQLLYRLILHNRNCDRIEPRTKFFTAIKRCLVVPWFSVLTYFKMMFTTTIHARSFELNESIISSPSSRHIQAQNRWWYRVPHWLRQNRRYWGNIQARHRLLLI